MKTRNHTDAPLWAITTYFNVVGDDIRLRNYEKFRCQLDIPLVAVELSFNTHFDLSTRDADILIQLHGGDVLWQKERLLNIALDALPSGCDAVAWLDCDVVFENANWVSEALDSLSDSLLIQPFSRVFDLSRNQIPDRSIAIDSLKYRHAITALIVDGTFLEEWFRMPGASMLARYAPGFAWVARVDLLRQHGFYDGNILGNGDKLLFNAALGRFNDAVTGYGLNEEQAIHYVAWAQGFHEAVNSRIGYIPQRLFHLWHGDLSCRRYGPRVHEFMRFNFDPFVDIKISPSGSWEWSSQKPEMHRFVRDVLMSHQYTIE